MSQLVPTPVPPRTAYRSRWSVPVPWGWADDMSCRLRRLGYPSTVCLNPETQEARLEPWPGVPVPAFLAAVGEYLTARERKAKPTRRATPALSA